MTLRSATRRRNLGLIGCLALIALVIQGSGCRSTRPKQPHADRVVVLSIDGISADTAWDWLEDEIIGDPASLPGFVKHGTSARRLIPIDPTVTATTHATMATGRLPDTTGVVSNVFRRAGDPAGRPTSGFNYEIEPPTVTEIAREAGLRTGSIAWPGVDLHSGHRHLDFGVEWPAPPLQTSSVDILEISTAVENERFPIKDDIVARQWTLPIDLGDGSHQELGIIAYDGEEDRRGRYDTIMFRGPGDDQWQKIDDSGWFAVRAGVQVESKITGPVGSWHKVVHLDRFDGTIRLYRGGFYELRAHPESLQDRLADEVGFWPGGGDDLMLREWWLDAGHGLDIDTYVEQLLRLEEYLAAVRRVLLRDEEFNLLFCASPIADRFLHSNLLIDQDQWAHSPGRAFAAREARLKTSLAISRSIAQLWLELNQDSDALVVISAHGMAPVKDGIRAERVLIEAGIAIPHRSGAELGLDATSWVNVQSSGPVAHLYLNLEGRDPSGNVAEENGDELMRRAARAFADLEVDGEAVVESILTNEEASSLRLSHPNSGDLIVFLKPGYTFVHGASEPVIEATKFYGQHGYLSHHPEMHGVLFARGAGIGRRKLDEMRLTDVFGFIRRILPPTPTSPDESP